MDRLRSVNTTPVDRSREIRVMIVD
jgi:hypothetical protein